MSAFNAISSDLSSAALSGAVKTTAPHNKTVRGTHAATPPTRRVAHPPPALILERAPVSRMMARHIFVTSVRKLHAMRIINTPQDMKALIGEEVGVSDWVTIDQPTIDKFAEATGDHQWIHVDVARAAKEMPGGKTIAHGFLSLSLLPRLAATLWRIEKRSRGINYGLNKVRFTATVPEGSRVRLRQKLLAADDVKDNGVRLTFENTLELEGHPQPALVAEALSIVYP
jgi:acyl dehydratase